MTDDKLFSVDDAHRLDDPERVQWMPPEPVLDALRLAPGQVVADIGAGTGYFALPIARRVAPGGRVLAIDVQDRMLALLRDKLAGSGAPDNIEFVQGDAAATTLEDACADRVVIANVWHEVDDPLAVARELWRVLAPGGRLAVLDWRPDVPSPPGPPLHHRVAPAAVAATLSEAGFGIDHSGETGSYSYLVVATRG